jgi:hypothetical protein
LRPASADPIVAVGTVLEAAALVGVPLFDADPVVRQRHQELLAVELKLLPQAARTPRVEAEDDF